MQPYIDQILAFISVHQQWAGPIIGLVSFGESLLIVGLFVPATIILPLTGVLIANDTLEFTGILLWGVAGAILGDAVSHWIGRAYGPALLKSGILRKRRRSVARTRLLFYRYGFLAVFAGRFMGAFRSLIPGMAGIMKMPQGRFQLANVLSGVIWFPWLLLPGYLGVRGADALGVTGSAAILALLAVICIVVIVSRRRRAARPPQKKQ
ncbi:DedA family protein [Advenella mimigardefordensis]|uniref:Putative membrane protein n=1 Tax=Advenella mimigardefordensis (strain DSM 17166 / LMG 22922 / DPN7) TaxID=1247726 RepID=W0PEL1_ADVMD|nr:DedA family protein [Advenella mimigardefordensis]AHG63680.1 putative membrane protein [Advenella mimigardefordensis DPN7]